MGNRGTRRSASRKSFFQSHIVAEVVGKKRMTKPTGSLFDMRTFGQ